MKICVIGAGIIALPTAVNVIEQIADSVPNLEVHLISELFSPHTTGDGSAGFWEPYLLQNTPSEYVLRWGSETMEHIMNLCRSELASQLGAFPIFGYNISKKYREPPSWKNAVSGHRPMEKNELKNFPDYNYGYAFTSAVIECKKYLPWLQERFLKKGGKVIKKKLNSLDELFQAYDIIVNCSGLGSNHLVGDKDVQPIKGQVIRVRAPWVKMFIMDDNENIYVLPGSDTVVLGGYAGRREWDLTIKADVKSHIMKRCQKLIPSLKHAEHVEDWVGFRPDRSIIRLERETIVHQHGTTQVIHNYGHGGSGVTLHWGCALDATKLVKEAIQIRTINSKL